MTRISCYACLREFTAETLLTLRERRGRYVFYKVDNRVVCPNCGNVFRELVEVEGDDRPQAEEVKAQECQADSGPFFEPNWDDALFRALEEVNARPSGPIP